MTATLRVMLDQLVSPTDPDLETASRELTRGLIDGTPAGCDVEAIAPAGRPVDLAGLAGVLGEPHVVVGAAGDRPDVVQARIDERARVPVHLVALQCRRIDAVGVQVEPGGPVDVEGVVGPNCDRVDPVGPDVAAEASARADLAHAGEVLRTGALEVGHGPELPIRAGDDPL